MIQHSCLIIHKISNILLLSCIFLLLSGCSPEKEPQKASSLDFTVVAGTDIPEDLTNLIEDRKQDPFQLTYSDGNNLFLVRGYGTQSSGGYNILIDDFFLSKEDTLALKTSLTGPDGGATPSKQASTPYVVLKTEYRAEPVVFLPKN